MPQNLFTFTQTPADGLGTKVTGLRPGHLYQFEVYAINKEGLSLPVRTRDPIKAENPYSEFIHGCLVLLLTMLWMPLL